VTTLFEPISVNTLTDGVTERIELAIVRGEIAPGAALNEVALARSLGVSRGPVREALRRLQGRKLVEWTPHAGPRVLTMTRQDIIEILTIREALEGMAARLAAIHGTEAEFDEVETIINAMKADGAKAPKAIGDPNLDLHTVIARASRNSRLIGLLTGEYYNLLRIFRKRSVAVPGRFSMVHNEHTRILEALRRRDPDGAERHMRRHISRVRENLELDAEEAPAPSTTGRTRRSRAEPKS
jgi:DNA-binding GntR family transcriptional regulator